MRTSSLIRLIGVTCNFEALKTETTTQRCITGFPDLWSPAPVPPGRCEVANSHLAPDVWQCLLAPRHLKMIPKVDHMPLSEAAEYLTSVSQTLPMYHFYAFENLPGDFPWWRLVATFGEQATEITGEDGIYSATVGRNDVTPPDIRNLPFEGCRFVFWLADRSCVHVFPTGDGNRKFVITRF